MPVKFSHDRVLGLNHWERQKQVVAAAARMVGQPEEEEAAAAVGLVAEGEVGAEVEEEVARKQAVEANLVEVAEVETDLDPTLVQAEAERPSPLPPVA